tara:strand:- start:5142 stop:5315 length:174 start_codon:yes stop_codon:yes gene_type:complete
MGVQVGLKKGADQWAWHPKGDHVMSYRFTKGTGGDGVKISMPAAHTEIHLINSLLHP